MSYDDSDEVKDEDRFTEPEEESEGMLDADLTADADDENVDAEGES